jgi:hypothetical protein
MPDAPPLPSQVPVSADEGETGSGARVSGALLHPARTKRMGTFLIFVVTFRSAVNTGHTSEKCDSEKEECPQFF